MRNTDERRLLYTALAGGVVLWLLDGIADRYFGADGPFGPLQLIFRTIFIFTFMLFGLAAASCLRRRREAEEALMQKERQLAQAQQSARMASWEWVIPDNRLDWSDSSATLLGADKGRLASTYDQFLGLIHPDDREAFDLAAKRSLHDHLPWQMDARVLQAEGSYLQTRFRGEVRCGDSGAPVAMTGVIQDVTDQRRTEAELHWFRELMRQSSDSIFAADFVTGRFLYVNDNACSELGFTREELLLMTVPDIEQRIRRGPGWEQHASLVAQKGTVALAGLHRRKDGSIFLVEANFKAVEHDGQQYIVAVARNTSDRAATEQALRESEEKYRSLVESTDDSIYLVDRSLRYHFINKRHLERLKASEQEVIGKAYGAFHSAEETRAFSAKVGRIFATGESHQYEHLSNRDGRSFLQTFSPVKDSSGMTVAVTVVSKNITKLKEIEDELRALSLTDELTGLYNRRGFLTLAEQQLKISDRLNREVLLLSADLDHLKHINDTFGHHVGDQMLNETAAVLRESFRSSDIIARIGGDEFVVLLIETNGDNPEVLTARMENSIALHNRERDDGHAFSLSYGMVRYNPRVHHSLEELMANADKLMYRQKKRHKLIEQPQLFPPATEG